MVLQDQILEHVAHFNYLGSEISKEKDTDKDKNKGDPLYYLAPYKEPWKIKLGKKEGWNFTEQWLHQLCIWDRSSGAN